ncbi:unnamed protein product, partial [Sphacelaria rigidula]
PSHICKSALCHAEHVRGGRGVLMILHAVVVRPLTSHPFKAGMTHPRFLPDQARIHFTRSAVMSSANRMKDKLYPAEIGWPEARMYDSLE